MGDEVLRIRKKKISREIDASRLYDVTGPDDPLPLIRWPLLEQQSWLDHGFTTRMGGVSTGTLSSLNFGYGAEKDPETVRENLRRLGRAAGFDPEKIVLSAQTHSCNIRIVNEDDLGKGYSRERDYADVDGFVTNVPGPVLIIYFSDCVPLLAADPVRRVIGCAHSGWRGTVADIGGVLIRTMQDVYGTRPEDVVAVIGPSICRDCFEVGEEVAEQFFRIFRQTEEMRDDKGREGGPRFSFGEICVPSPDEEKRRQGKYHVDLQEVCRLNFQRAGLMPEHISVPDICTCCNPGLLFSRRGAGGTGPYGQNASYFRIL